MYFTALIMKINVSINILILILILIYFDKMYVDMEQVVIRRQHVRLGFVLRGGMFAIKSFYNNISFNNIRIWFQQYYFCNNIFYSFEF